MNSSEIAAGTHPRTMHIPKVRNVNAEGRGRTMTSSSTPAQASRSQAVPSDPIRSMRPMATTMPICTDTCAAMAIVTPLRACSALTPALK